MIFKNGVVIEQYFYVDRIMLEYYEIYPADVDLRYDLQIMTIQQQH